MLNIQWSMGDNSYAFVTTRVTSLLRGNCLCRAYICIPEMYDHKGYTPPRATYKVWYFRKPKRQWLSNVDLVYNKLASLKKKKNQERSASLFSNSFLALSFNRSIYR